MRASLPLLFAAAVVSLAFTTAPASPAPAAAPQDPAEPAGPAFLEASRCATCHESSDQAAAMRDQQGRSVAPYDLWRGTMMANAARDPLWQAMVSAEVAAQPQHREFIENKCTKCHAPMAWVDANENLGRPLAMADLHGPDMHAGMADEGVSCTLCHQISPRGLGTEASFTGGFHVNTGKWIYGPYEDLFSMPMIRHTGFTPVPSDHVRESALCATCHTLFTDALDPEGRPTGHRLPEQTPYLEWRNSVYSTERARPGEQAASCQECHMPATDLDGAPIRTNMARNPAGRDFPRATPRQPYARHLFVGGNTLLPSIFRDNARELEVSAPAAAFTAVEEAARDQLQNRTAELGLVRAARSGERLLLDLEARNLAGHKLPSGHPLRRAWLRVTVEDAEGRLVFASGRHDDRGRILGGDGRVLPSESVGGPIEAHRTRLTSSDQVLIWQAVMEDSTGAPTWSLLAGARYQKDNRLLPLGWDPEHESAAVIGAIGTDGDEDFRGGADGVRVVVPAPADRGPYTVRAALLYQTADARFLDELFQAGTPETERFRRLWLQAPRPPEVMDQIAYRVE